MKLLKHPVFLTILGLLAVFGLSYYIAPLIGFEQTDEAHLQFIFALVFTLTITLIVLGFWAWSNWDSWSLSRALKGRKPKGPKPSGELERSFEIALGDLEARLPAGSVFGTDGVNRLPWVVILGPPGSGKTTTLDRSGLRFTQLGRKISGVGGTKNIVWWLSEDAVILDTAGRFSAIEESVEEWLGLLALLKRYRKRRPIDAVLLEVSLQEVADRTPEEIEDLAVRLRDRLQELQTRLGVRFPVYLVFSHADIVEGFSPFFTHVAEKERRAPWGFALDLDGIGTTSLSEVFDKSFNHLISVLEGRATEVAAELPDKTHRDAALCFPHELSRHREAMSYFTDVLFEARRGATERPWLTSVYFVSAIQDGTALAGMRTRTSEAVGAGSPPVMIPPDGGRSFFVRGLFDRILKEARDSARPTREARRSQRLRQVLSMVLLFPLVLGVGYKLTRLYAVESIWLNELTLAADTLAKGKSLPFSPDAVMRPDLRRELNHHGELRKVLVSHFPGSFTSDAQQLGKRLLIERIDEQLISPLQESFDYRLEQGQLWTPNSQDTLENTRFADGWLALKAAFILRRDACPKTSDDDLKRFLLDYFAGVWRAEVERNGDPDIYSLGGVDKLLLSSIAYYARIFIDEPWVESGLIASETLVESGSNNLKSSAPGDEIAFHLIMAGAGLAGIRPQLGGEIFSDKGIQQAFTFSGAPVFFDMANEGTEWWQCILKGVSPPGSVDKEGQFLVEGKQAWRAWLSNVAITEEMDTLDGAAKVLGAIGRDHQSELDDIFSVMGGYKPSKLDKDIAQKFFKIMQQAPIKGRAGQLAGCAGRLYSSTDSEEKPPACEACDNLKKEFQPYTDAVSGEKDHARAKAYSAYKSACLELRGALKDISDSTNREEKALQFVRDAMQDRQSPLRLVTSSRQTLVEALEQGRDRVTAEDLDALLQGVEERVYELVLPLATQRLKDAWRTEILSNPERPRRGQLGKEADYCKSVVSYIKGPVASFVDKQVKPLLEDGDLKGCAPASFPRGSDNTIPIAKSWCRQTYSNLEIAAYTQCPGEPPPAPEKPEPRQFTNDPSKIRAGDYSAIGANCPHRMERFVIEGPEGSFKCEISSGKCSPMSKTTKTRLLVQLNKSGDRLDSRGGWFDSFEALAREEGKIDQKNHIVKFKVRENDCDGFNLSLPFVGGDPPPAPPKGDEGDGKWKRIKLSASIVK